MELTQFNPVLSEDISSITLGMYNMYRVFHFYSSYCSWFEKFKK